MSNREREYSQQESHAITHTSTAEDAVEIRPYGRNLQSRDPGDLLVTHAAKQRFDNPSLLWR